MSVTTTVPQTVPVRVSDATGQRAFRAPRVPVDVSIGQMVQTFLQKMGLGQAGSPGRGLCFRARLERQARFLNSSERVGDCLQPDDELTLTPDIQAG